MGSLRILIVDDYETVRRGVRSLLSSRRDWVVCGEAGDGLEAVEKGEEPATGCCTHGRIHAPNGWSRGN